MAHPFEIVVEQTLDADPEQVWEALTTGPGMDGWFMGRNHVTPGVGGTCASSCPAPTSSRRSRRGTRPVASST